MELNAHIEGIRVEAQIDKLVIQSGIPLKILSSAVLNGGPFEANTVINVHVPRDHDDADLHRHAEDFLKDSVRKSDLNVDNVVGLMTAADVQKVSVSTQQYGDVVVSAFVTAGISFSATAADEIFSKGSTSDFVKTGTINIILLIDANLSGTCMVLATCTAVEAKTVALKELDIRSRFSGNLATGTVSDSILIASTRRGKLIKYAGPATMLGELIGKAVKQAVKSAIQNQAGIKPDRPVADRLVERGVSFQEITDAFLKGFPELERNAGKLRVFKEKLKLALLDPNVATFVIDSLRMDEDNGFHLLPKSMKTHEILGKTVAEYISGRKGVLEYTRLRNIYSNITEGVGPFLQEVLCGTVAGVYSNLSV